MSCVYKEGLECVFAKKKLYFSGGMQSWKAAIVLLPGVRDEVSHLAAHSGACWQALTGAPR